MPTYSCLGVALHFKSVLSCWSHINLTPLVSLRRRFFLPFVKDKVVLFVLNSLLQGSSWKLSDVCMCAPSGKVQGPDWQSVAQNISRLRPNAPCQAAFEGAVPINMLTATCLIWWASSWCCVDVCVCMCVCVWASLVKRRLESFQPRVVWGYQCQRTAAN